MTDEGRAFLDGNHVAQVVLGPSLYGGHVEDVVFDEGLGAIAEHALLMAEQLGIVES